MGEACALKPAVRAIALHPPDEVAQRAAEIKRVVEEDFGEELPPGRAAFQFRAATPAISPGLAPPKSADAQQSALRFIYSYFALFGDPLLDPQLDPYPEGLLRRLSDLGVNGVWLHVVLRDLAPGGTAFPEFGAGHEQRLANLRAIVERAKKYGIGVYLYMNEPRAMPAAFFQVKGRAEMAGVGEGGFVALCTSHPAVRQWMGDALAHVFRQVPDLGGVFTITASENLTNCAVRGNWRSCPHCKNRTDTEIIAEVNATIEEGVHRSNPKAKVIVWDWGWRGHGDAPDIMRVCRKRYG